MYLELPKPKRSSSKNGRLISTVNSNLPYSGRGRRRRPGRGAESLDDHPFSAFTFGSEKLIISLLPCSNRPSQFALCGLKDF